MGLELMQNRYAGDCGDYVKLSILRHLCSERQLGVLWWLLPNESHNADGKHIGYLEKPAVWRGFDPDVFDALKGLLARSERSVAALEALDLLPGARYFSDVLPIAGRPVERRSGREHWFERAKATVEGCDLLFIDPDNGLETGTFSYGSVTAGKSVTLSELARLRQVGRTLVVYHHHTRMAGGNITELAHWGVRLAELGFRVDALRASAGTARAFFLLDANDKIRSSAHELSRRWGSRLSWHPHLG